LRSSSPLQFSRSLQLCSTYWHFLFVLWLAVFALLTRSAETYNTLAAMCGF
jgi:cytochrome c oxidase subunit III